MEFITDVRVWHILSKLKINKLEVEAGEIDAGFIERLRTLKVKNTIIRNSSLEVLVLDDHVVVQSLKTFSFWGKCTEGIHSHYYSHAIEQLQRIEAFQILKPHINFNTIEIIL